jgi:hypothetical protein
MFRDHVALQGLVVAEEAATAQQDRLDPVALLVLRVLLV